MTIHAVIFDYDGTAIDSMPLVHAGVCEVFNACGIVPPGYPEFLRSFRSPYLDWYRSRGIMMSDEDIREIYFRNTRSDDAPLVHGFADAVMQLRSRRCLLGVVSSHEEFKIRRRLVMREGLFGPMDPIVGLAFKKVTSLRGLCAAYGLDSHEALYIGDIESDVRDGNEAGLITAAYLGADGSEEAFPEHRPNIWIRDMASLPEMIRTL